MKKGSSAMKKVRKSCCNKRKEGELTIHTAKQEDTRLQKKANKQKKLTFLECRKTKTKERKNFWLSRIREAAAEQFLDS